MSREQKVVYLMKMTNTTKETATAYLAAALWNLTNALAAAKAAPK